MAHSRIQHPTMEKPIRATIYAEEQEHIEAVARQYNLDASQALRLIIHQHAEWAPYVRPVDVPSEEAETPA